MIAGGYDPRIPENAEVFADLVVCAKQLNLSDHVTFLRSCSSATKVSLMRSATALLYTPDKEHFGIVPVEAMYLGCPVIAVNSGGPMETVNSGHTGFLVENNAQDFAKHMHRFVESPELRHNMGAEAHTHVLSHLSFEAMAAQLSDIIAELSPKSKEH